jgi:hypothetical protein
VAHLIEVVDTADRLAQAKIALASALHRLGHDDEWARPLPVGGGGGCSEHREEHVHEVGHEGVSGEHRPWRRKRRRRSVLAPAGRRLRHRAA